MSMVERVARAMARYDNPKSENWWPSYENRARVAIEAMREADNEMLEAMHNAMFADKFTGRELPMLGAGFEAAIDAALT